jgi:hypothetical protein
VGGEAPAAFSDSRMVRRGPFAAML